jgi:hypothetical protein
MKALLLKEYNDFVYQEAPMPQVHEDQVLIRVRASVSVAATFMGWMVPPGAVGRPSLWVTKLPV